MVVAAVVVDDDRERSSKRGTGQYPSLPDNILFRAQRSLHPRGYCSSRLCLSSETCYYYSSQGQRYPSHRTVDMLVDPTKSGTALFRPFFTISHCFRNRPAAVRLNSLLLLLSLVPPFSLLLLVIVHDPHLIDPCRTLISFAVSGPFTLSSNTLVSTVILEPPRYTRGPGLLSLRGIRKYHL